jgi:AcrR family transcriptional regulator
MKALTSVREKIISSTILLIQKGDGDIDKITTRAIAKDAGVTSGLINYHFQTKRNLITICVQRMIKQSITNFKPHGRVPIGRRRRLTAIASQTFEFLFSNPSLARISILDDLSTPSLNSNTILSHKGIQKDICTTDDKEMLSFIILATMQVAFLTSPISQSYSEYNLSNTSDREAFIAKLISLMFNYEEKDEEDD